MPHRHRLPKPRSLISAHLHLPGRVGYPAQTICHRPRKSNLPSAALPRAWRFPLPPFNHEDAVASASFDFKAFKDGGEKDRQSLKDDLKIIGHAHARNLGYLITDDADTMFEYCETLRKDGRTHLRAIKLQTGFSLQHFAPDGQKDFPIVMEAAGEYATE